MSPFRIPRGSFLLAALFLAAGCATDPAQPTTEPGSGTERAPTVTGNLATISNLVVRPLSSVFDSRNVSGVAGDFAPSFGGGSLASNGVAKTDMYFTPAMLFGRNVTLGEVVSMSYWTKKGSTHVASTGDWFLNIYTKPYSGDVSTPTWYGDRIGAEPYFSANIADPANAWNNWTTSGTTNTLRFFESTQGASGATFGAYTDPDWATFLAGNALSGYPYAGHEILSFSIQTASAWAAGFIGQVDGLRIELADGSIGTVNFEPNLPQCTLSCYVDAAAGDDGNGGTSPADSKKTINGALLQVSTGGTIYVATGTYPERVAITKTVSLLGAGIGNSTIVGPIALAAASTIQVAAAGVVIDGFTITRAGNNFAEWNLAGLTQSGVAVQGQGNTVELRNSQLTGLRTGVDINNSNGNSIHNNIIDNNRTGMIFRNQTDNTSVVNNFITNNWTMGVLFLDASSGTNSPVQSALNSTFSNNAINGNWYGQVVDRQSGGSIPAPGTNLKNFKANWWGTTAPVVAATNSVEPDYSAQIPDAFGGSAVAPGGQPEILGPASANIDYIAFQCTGTDVSPTIGFQPAGVLSTLGGVCLPAAPTVVTAASDASGTEGQTLSTSGSFSGTGLTLTANNAVGTFTPNNAAGTWTWSYSTTDDVALTSITVTATDAFSQTATDEFDYSATNVAPSLIITAPASGSIYPMGSTVSLTSTFTDPGTGDTHTCTFAWGDSNTDGPTASGVGTCNESHAFTAAGVYNISVTVTDDDGGSDTQTVMVVVYDPTAGFVTGGGWINSPAGAFTANESLTGKANFGFVSKYEKGKTVPSGNTEFQFKAAGLNFKGTSMEWLVISGAKAQYKGAGTINGDGDFRFMLTAIDGQVNGGGGADKFRIRIWDNVGGGLVYDNQLSAPDSEDPTTLLGGGSIVVHK